MRFCGFACCVVPLVFRAPRVVSGRAAPCAAARQISGVAMPRQISGRRVACPPARRPRCELRSARRLEARPGPAGPAAASNRAVLVVSVLSVSLRHRPRTPRPRRHTPQTPPPLPASLHERNTAPAWHPTAWLTPVVKEISPLLAQNGQNTALFSVPGRRIFHGTPPPFTQGRLFFHLNPPTPQAG